MDFFDPIGGRPYLISCPGKRDFYLVSYGALHPQDLPPYLQRVQRQESELESYKIQAALAWQREEQGRSLKDAEKWLQNIPDSWVLYLSESDREKHGELNRAYDQEQSDRAYEIATVMMKNRLAYHVEIGPYDVVEDSDRISIIEPWFSDLRQLKPGDTLTTLDGSLVLGLREPPRDNILLLDRKLKRTLLKGTPLFLKEEGEFVMGDPNWDIESSRKKLFSRTSTATPQLSQVTGFFIEEQTPRLVGNREPEEAEPEIPLANGQSDSETLPSNPLPTGERSSGDSNPSDAETPPLPLIIHGS